MHHAVVGHVADSAAVAVAPVPRGISCANGGVAHGNPVAACGLAVGAQQRCSKSGTSATAHQPVAAAAQWSATNRPSMPASEATILGGNAFEVTRLLAGLQRATVPGGDAHLEFLFRKFAALSERLIAAEVGQREAEKHYADMEAELRAHEAEEDVERRQMGADREVALSERAILAVELMRAEHEQAEAQGRSQAAACESQALASQVAVLDEQHVDRTARLLRYDGRLRKFHMVQPGDVEDLRKLQGRVATLCACQTAMSTELRAVRERETKEEVEVSKVKAELTAEDEARRRSNANASRRREELDAAFASLADLRERFADVQLSRQRVEAEQRRRAERRERLGAESRKAAACRAAAVFEAERLRDVGPELGRVAADVEDLRSRTREEKEFELCAREETEEHVMLASRKSRGLAELAHGPLEQAEHRCALAAMESDGAEARRAAAEDRVQWLRHESTAGGGARRGLETELKILLEESETLRHERVAALAQHGEACQRLQLVSPALAETRRQLTELEAALDQVHARTACERQHSDRLDRETGICHEKVRALRDENVRLAERCAELESSTPRVGRAASSRAALPWRRSAGALAATPKRAAGASVAARQAPGGRRPRPQSAMPSRSCVGPTVLRIPAPRTPRRAPPASAPSPTPLPTPPLASGAPTPTALRGCSLRTGVPVFAVGGADDVVLATDSPEVIRLPPRVTPLLAESPEPRPQCVPAHATKPGGGMAFAGHAAGGLRQPAAAREPPPSVRPPPAPSSPHGGGPARGPAPVLSPAGSTPPWLAGDARDLQFLVNWVRSEEERLPRNTALRPAPSP